MLAFEVSRVFLGVLFRLEHVAHPFDQAKLKQLITQALSLTSSSQAITSIQPSTRQNAQYPLSASSFDTLFTVSPAVLPNQSAAATRLALGDTDSYDEELPLKDGFLDKRGLFEPGVVGPRVGVSTACCGGEAGRSGVLLASGVGAASSVVDKLSVDTLSADFTPKPFVGVVSGSAISSSVRLRTFFGL